jgi:hypothetical protein
MLELYSEATIKDIVMLVICAAAASLNDYLTMRILMSLTFGKVHEACVTPWWMQHNAMPLRR